MHTITLLLIKRRNVVIPVTDDAVQLSLDPVKSAQIISLAEDLYTVYFNRCWRRGGEREEEGSDQLQISVALVWDDCYLPFNVGSVSESWYSRLVKYPDLSLPLQPE